MSFLSGTIELGVLKDQFNLLQFLSQAAPHHSVLCLSALRCLAAMLQRGAMQSIAGYSSAGHGSAGAVQSGALQRP